MTQVTICDQCGKREADGHVVYWRWVHLEFPSGPCAPSRITCPKEYVKLCSTLCLVRYVMTQVPRIVGQAVADSWLGKRA